MDMKSAFGSVVVVAAVLAAGTVSMRAAAPQTTTITPADSTLDNKIEKRIHDSSSLKKYDIDVKVDNGVATLTGTVATEAERRRAAQLATISGVSRVDNQIVVDMNATRSKGTAGTVERNTSKAAEKTKEGTAKAAEKTKEGTEKAIDKTKEGLDKATEGAEKGWDKTKEGVGTAADKSAAGIAKAGEAITDTFIKTRVKSKFIGEDLLKDSDISVDVNDHVVTLSGTVMSAAGRARAIEEAKKVDGVHQVIDKLTIGPPKQ
jgi:osmotically-inducible protein OsmY